MIQPRKTDSQMVGHARRELEIAGLFTEKKDQDYDGFIGKGVLALVKVFDDWSKGDPARMQALEQVFSFAIHGDLLSPPSDDPDEWEEITVEEQTLTRNKRNIMYITRDDRKTWFNLRTEQKGICNDHKTGKPLEGVKDPNGKAEQTAKDQEGPADAGDAGHGENAELPAADSKDAGATEGSQGVEETKLDSGVEPQSEKDQGSSENAAPKSKKRKA